MTVQSEQETQLVDRMIDAACAGDGETPGREQRRFRRHTCDGWVGLVQVDETGRKHAAVTLRAEDISAAGLGAYSWDPVAAGTHGAVMVRRPDGQLVLIGAEVVYCKPRSRADFDCGMRFTATPREITMDDFRDEDGVPFAFGPLAA